MSISFRVTDERDAAVEALDQSLTDFNAADVGPSEKRLLSVLAEDDDGALSGGLSGYTAWRWLYIRWLWVDDDQRGRGIAATLLERAEAEAKERGCVGAHIDTFSPVALRVYQRSGYQTFGELPDFVEGRTRSFLQKRWA